MPRAIEITGFTFQGKPFVVLATVEFHPGGIGHYTAWVRNRSAWWRCSDSSILPADKIAPGKHVMVFAVKARE